MPKLSYQELIDRHLKILKSLQYKSGLFAASQKGAGIDYDKSWLRDNFYETIAFEVIGDWDTVEKTYDAIIRLFLRHEAKIDWAIENKPSAAYQHIHARFNPETFEEFWDEWGNKQNDAVGCILFRIGELEINQHRSILKTEHGVRIVQKLVKYLEAIEYWKAPDNGVWEEGEELHASSVGACVAGLKSIKRLQQIEVPDWIIEKGQESLNSILPRESESKFVDLALLSLLWPYEVVSGSMEEEILANVEYHLLRDRGVIRYKGDRFYNRNPDGFSEEAEWTFGLSWLAIIHQKMGHKEKAQELLTQAIMIDTKEGQPELYFSNSPEYNEHTPLGWSESLFIVALFEMERHSDGQSAIDFIPKHKVESWMSPGVQKARVNASSYLKSLIKNGHIKGLTNPDQLNDNDIQVLENGESSACFFVKTQEQNIIVKFRHKGLEIEADCLKAWKSVGAAVPELYEYGEVSDNEDDKISFLIEEAILNSNGELAQVGSKFISEYPEKIEELGKMMGKELAKMHQAKYDGHIGRFNDEANSFDKWSDYLIDSLEKNKAILERADIDLGKLDKLKEIINTVNFPDKGVFVHFDFTQYNALITSQDPLAIKIIDPNGLIGDPYLDLTRLLNSVIIDRELASAFPGDEQKLITFQTMSKICDAFTASYKAEVNLEIDPKRLLVSQLYELILRTRYHEGKLSTEDEIDLRTRRQVLRLMFEEIVSW